MINRATKAVLLMIEELLGSYAGRQIFVSQRCGKMVHNHDFGRNGVDYDAGRTAMRMMIKYTCTSDTAQLVFNSMCLTATRIRERAKS